MLRDIAEQFQRWLKEWSDKRNIPAAGGAGSHDDRGRRQQKESLASSNRQSLGGPVQLRYEQPAMGTEFVRICPYLPFSARVCLNQHHCWPSGLRTPHVVWHFGVNAQFDRVSARPARSSIGEPNSANELPAAMPICAWTRSMPVTISVTLVELNARLTTRASRGSLSHCPPVQRDFTTCSEDRFCGFEYTMTSSKLTKNSYAP